VCASVTKQNNFVLCTGKAMAELGESNDAYYWRSIMTMWSAWLTLTTKNLANTNGSATAVNVGNPSKTKSKSVARERQTTGDKLSMVFLLVLTRGRQQSCSANAVSAENRKFFHPLSFSALVRGDPLQIYGKALRFLKLESSRQPTMKIWWS